MRDDERRLSGSQSDEEQKKYWDHLQETHNLLVQFTRESMYAE